jgi:hypothetical protein
MLYLDFVLRLVPAVRADLRLPLMGRLDVGLQFGPAANAFDSGLLVTALAAEVVPFAVAKALTRVTPRIHQDDVGRYTV